MVAFNTFDAKTKKILGLCVLVVLIIFALGIMIGFFSGKGSVKEEGYKTLNEAFTGTCDIDTFTEEGKKYALR